MIPTNRQIHAQLHISRPDGVTWEDVTDYLARAEVNLGDVGGGASGVDGVVRQMSFTLRREGDSFAPRDRSSSWNTFNSSYAPLLWPGREVLLRAAITAPGEVPTSWVTMFHGIMGDNISVDGSTVYVACRDLAKRLQDLYIEDVRQYGSEEGTPAETVIQQILDDNLGANSPVLYAPVSPGFMVKPYSVEYCTVWDAVIKVVQQFGWFIGYRWDSTLGEYRLMLMEPPRNKSAATADFVLDYEDDFYSETLDISDADVRNAVKVTYRNAVTGKRESVTVVNQASIDEFGRRAMEIEEDSASLIDTEAEAQQLANAALSDLSQLTSTTRLEMPLLPEMDVFSGIVVHDPRVSSTDDFFGVESVRHTLDFENGRFRTEVVAGGKVVGAHMRWLQMQTRPGSPSKPSHPTPITGTAPDVVQWDTCEFNKEVILRWFPVRGAVAYELRFDEDWGQVEGMVYRGHATSFTLRPTQRAYTFYIRATNGAGNYSTVTAIKELTNATPSTPPQPLVKEFFQALWIDVQPVLDNDIDGYYLYVTPSDGNGNPTGATEKTPLATAQRITYEAPSGSSFLIQVSAYDPLGEGNKSPVVEATAKHVDSPDIPDGLLEQSKLSQSLSSKIDEAKTRADGYWDQVIGYPTEEDATIAGTSYTLAYRAGDVYVGTEIETNPNAFFDLTDQSDNELVDANGEPVTITDVQDETGVTLLGAGKPEWYGGGISETITLILSAAPANSSCRVHYAVKKNLRQLAKDALLKKGVTAKQIDANVIDAIENLKGAPWNETLSPDAQIVTLASRVSSTEDTVSVHSASIQANADAIELKASQTDLNAVEGRVTTTENTVTQLSDEYHVKIQRNASGEEVVTGFGLALDDQNISEFGVLADRFKIYGTMDGQPKPIFAVDTQNDKVYILGDLIADGTIEARMVGTNEIIANVANIRAGVIENAHIKDATIQGAKIADATIGDAKITGTLSAEKIQVGPDSTFASGYNPNTALTTANNAQTTADNAASTASAAQTTANAAKQPIDDLAVANIELGVNGIITTDTVGNHSDLNAAALAFYEAGSSVPNWYSRRVAYGTAQNGQYVSLGWDKAPKVITAISSLQSYNPSYPNNELWYESYATGITADGFYVYGRNIVPGAPTTVENGTWGYPRDTWKYSAFSPSNATKIRIEMSLEQSGSGWSKGYLEYQKYGGSWIRVAGYGYTIQNDYATYTISGLSPGQYRWRFYEDAGYSAVSPYLSYTFTSWGDLQVATGDVMWIAVEGGADGSGV